MAVKKYIYQDSDSRDRLKWYQIPNVARAGLIVLWYGVTTSLSNFISKEAAPAETLIKTALGSIGVVNHGSDTVSGIGRGAVSSYDYMAAMNQNFKETGLVVASAEGVDELIKRRDGDFKKALIENRITQIEEEVSKLTLVEPNTQEQVVKFFEAYFKNVDVDTLGHGKIISYYNFFKSFDNFDNQSLENSSLLEEMGLAKFKSRFIQELTNNNDFRAFKSKISNAYSQSKNAGSENTNFSAELADAFNQYADPLFKEYSKIFYGDGVLDEKQKLALADFEFYKDTINMMGKKYDAGELSAGMQRLYESICENNRNRELLGSYGADMLANLGEPLNGINLIYNSLENKVGIAAFKQLLGFDNKHPSLWNPKEDMDMFFNLITSFEDIYKYGGQKVFYAKSFVTGDNNSGAGFSSIMFGNVTVMPISTKTNYRSEASPAGQWYLNNFDLLLDRFSDFVDTMKHAYNNNLPLEFTMSHENHEPGSIERGGGRRNERIRGDKGVINAQDFFGKELTHKNLIMAYEQFINFETSKRHGTREFEKFGITTATFTDAMEWLELAVHLGAKEHTRDSRGNNLDFRKLKDLPADLITYEHDLRGLRDVSRGDLKTDFVFKSRDMRHLQLHMIAKAMFGEDDPNRTIYKIYKSGLFNDGLEVNYNATQNLGAIREKNLEAFRDEANERAVENKTRRKGRKEVIEVSAQHEENRGDLKIEANIDEANIDIDNKNRKNFSFKLPSFINVTSVTVTLVGASFVALGMLVNKYVKLMSSRDKKPENTEYTTNPENRKINLDSTQNQQNVNFDALDSAKVIETAVKSDLQKQSSTSTTSTEVRTGASVNGSGNTTTQTGGSVKTNAKIGAVGGITKDTSGNKAIRFRKIPATDQKLITVDTAKVKGLPRGFSRQ